jgi:hypothetical protein
MQSSWGVHAWRLPLSAQERKRVQYRQAMAYINRLSEHVNKEDNTVLGVRGLVSLRGRRRNKVRLELALRIDINGNVMLSDSDGDTLTTLNQEDTRAWSLWPMVMNVAEMSRKKKTGNKKRKKTHAEEQANEGDDVDHEGVAEGYSDTATVTATLARLAAAPRDTTLNLQG